MKILLFLIARIMNAKKEKHLTAGFGGIKKINFLIYFIDNSDASM